MNRCLEAWQQVPRVQNIEEGIFIPPGSRFRGLQTAITEVGGEIANCGSKCVRTRARQSLLRWGRRRLHGRRRRRRPARRRPPTLHPSFYPSAMFRCFLHSCSTDRRIAAWPPSPLHAGGKAEEGATGAAGVIKLDVQDKGRNIGDADAADAIAVQPGYMVHVPGDEGGPSRENEDEEMS